VARINAGGTALEYCGYLGGAGRDWLLAIAIDERGNNAFVAGDTESDEKTLPVRVGPDLSFNNGQYEWDGFVAEVMTTQLSLSGASRIGGTVTLSLMDDPGRPYQIASSLGDGPTWIGVRKLGLSVDGLFLLSVSGTLPGVFSGYAGVLDGKGQAQASIRIPNHSSLLGLLVRSAFVTLQASAPDRIYSISDPVMFQITSK
jgi:hypothetical protein